MRTSSDAGTTSSPGSATVSLGFHYRNSGLLVFPSGGVARFVCGLLLLFASVNQQSTCEASTRANNRTEASVSRHRAYYRAARRTNSRAGQRSLLSVGHPGAAGE